MGVTGEYVLMLICDNDSCLQKGVVKVYGSDAFAAMSEARSKGWRISSARACCPACAKGEQKGI